jgi:hypothetical protein
MQQPFVMGLHQPFPSPIVAAPHHGVQPPLATLYPPHGINPNQSPMMMPAAILQQAPQHLAVMPPMQHPQFAPVMSNPPYVAYLSGQWGM